MDYVWWSYIFTFVFALFPLGVFFLVLFVSLLARSQEPLKSHVAKPQLNIFAELSTF